MSKCHVFMFLLLVVSFALLPVLVSTLSTPRWPDGGDTLFACGTLDRFAAAYELLERLGRGRWGTVHRVRERLTGDSVTVKDTAEEAEVLREYACLKDKRHPNIVRAYARFQGPGRAVMVMQY
jgi:serine/threonine protein kinase